MPKKNVREAALDILEAIEKHQSYSNLLLNQVIEKNHITGPDVRLLTELTYGTLQRKLTLDYYLKPFLQKKVENWVLNLLRLSLYQMLYLDKIPDRAILFEAVEIAKRRSHRGISGMVNGVLRAIQRKGVPSLDNIKDPVERLSIETSHPKWLVQRWTEQFGFDKTKKMCETNLIAPLQTARVNLTRSSREEVITLLENEGFIVQESPILSEAIQSLKGNLVHSDCYKKGLITIQDESSMIVANVMEIEPNQLILDCCAAPGGKTTHIAEKLNGTGKVIAHDLHEHKVKLIKENAERLGLHNIETIAMDSRKIGEHYPKNSFDRVLVDAPCSGLGVLRRKPDIKYVKSLQDIEALQTIQHSILAEAAEMVKSGGILTYSTCTVDKEENEGTVQYFLDRFPDFEAYSIKVPSTIEPFVQHYRLQIFPQDFGSDGFFIACFKKK
ncbi:16S rRNA methyltransferase [Heyndrickxia shackletonii]|uniref:16S rRNA (cytosine(967)-C(5))-methyltransferase n=2 Tax=Bacillaceae TaxID=186817 RepID=A0A0Q3TL17_9BACI|nr:16S rRNA (cytosine(967)-C(5))-methyltransferase RsmB [Heyndrickxia shackletonii]KQL54680.1 16S rRNA methyltransferase [Heyndrickxia shackletonii]NEY98330.1 16S rRNA (cytosine(967)-C(5))-methyltransferase RsmB [Heyndrickxia shackletonii]RTZ57858.1 16S rRNA (cytosine(967)-C(5))-methyltransferase RsmB [Bacillus sp. SAJ1]